MDAWLTAARDAVASAAGIEHSELSLREDERKSILDLARIAAHESGDRTNAPLLCYLVGIARGRGAGLDGLVEAVRRSSS